MKIAIVHYHLGPGGVTQSILSTSALLTDRHIRHVILSGDHGTTTAAHAPNARVHGLDYISRCHHAQRISAPDLTKSLRETAAAHLGTPPDLWHFHNHSLGKNPTLTAAVALLARSGERILLHIHDLAEDGRPALYANIHHLADLYPVAPHIHYGFLNQRDLDAFVRAGLPPEQATLLPATAQQLPQPVPPAPPSTPPLLFAPIRGIRRKNLGELALLAVLLPPPTHIAISRAPTDPESLRIHDTWKAFARIHAPRLLFQVTDHTPPAPGAAPDFHSWISHCTHLVGTSICEGFGLPFLEARAWKRPFIGRRLPHLSHLVSPSSTYDRLLIPAEWIAKTILREALDTSLARDDRQRRHHPRRHHLHAILDQLTRDEWLDFGNLPEAIQQAIIERCSDPASREQVHLESAGTIQPAIPWLLQQVSTRTPTPTNSPDLPSADPSPIYQKLLDAPSSTTVWLPPAAILKSYHAPSTFHFLTSPPAPPPTQGCRYRVILFDIYGTLLHIEQGAIRPAPEKDEAIARMIRSFRCHPPESPTTALHEGIRLLHTASPEEFPEVDLTEVWRTLLDPPPSIDLERLVIATEDIRSPARPVAGAFDTIRHLSLSGIRMGLLSNAQCNALHSLHPVSELFDPDLTILSYQWGIAKPSPQLFEEMNHRISQLGIQPHQVLFIGNSPTQDIAPAISQGWHTALFSPTPPTHDSNSTLTFSHYPSLLQQIKI